MRGEAEIRRIVYAVVYGMLKLRASKIPISILDATKMGNHVCFLRNDGVWANESFVEKAKWMDF